MPEYSIIEDLEIGNASQTDPQKDEEGFEYYDVGESKANHEYQAKSIAANEMR
jgi:hypothetical protein